MLIECEDCGFLSCPLIDIVKVVHESLELMSRYQLLELLLLRVIKCYLIFSSCFVSFDFFLVSLCRFLLLGYLLLNVDLLPLLEVCLCLEPNDCPVLVNLIDDEVGEAVLDNTRYSDVLLGEVFLNTCILLPELRLL